MENMVFKMEKETDLEVLYINTHLIQKWQFASE